SLVEAEMGGVFLMDYRVWHGGTENPGDKPRPLLYSLYSRPWFFDWANYSKQKRLVVPRATVDGLAEEMRPLLRLAEIV
ncbi:MAG: phytanoyl-CoA dioxygenase, partial [Thermoanaerobaculia bacterium]